MHAQARMSSMDHTNEDAWNDAPAEEPLAIEREDGLRHLPEVRAHAFLGLVRAGQELEHRLDRELREAHGIGLRAFEVLLHLAVFSPAPGGRLRMTQLTEQAPLSQSRTSRLVAELDNKGMVSRAKASEDSRAIDVTLTGHGRKVFIAAQETHLEGLDRYLFSRLSWEQVTQLATITETILVGVST